MLSENSRALARWNLQRLGDRSSLSQRVALIYMPFGFIGPLLLDPSRLGGSLADWLIVALAGQAALMAVFFAAWTFYPRLGLGSSHPLYVSVTILAGALFRGVVLAAVPVVIGITNAFEWTYRLGAALATQTGMLAIFGILVSSYDYHRRIAAQLSEEKLSLEITNRTMQAKLEEVRDLTVIQVRGLVEPLIHELDAASERAPMGDERRDIQNSIRQLVDEELRPLSHRLVSDEAADAVVHSEVSPPRSVRIPLPRFLSFKRTLPPMTVGLLTVLLALSPTIRELRGIEAFVFPLVSGICVSVLVLVMRAGLHRWSPRLWLAVLLNGVWVSLAFLGAWFLQSSIGLPLPSRLTTVVAVTGALVGILFALYQAVTQQRQETEDSLRVSVEESLRATSILRQQVFVMRRQLGRAIHGSLQSACHAAAMRLAAEPQPSPQLLREVRDDLSQAVSQISQSENSYAHLIGTLSDIETVWRGTCGVAWVLDHPTVRVIAANPVAAVSVGEIARECVTNAVKHGQADAVRISISRAPEGIEMEIADNGRLRKKIDRLGVGSHMLDELAMEWQRIYAEDGVTVRATVAALST